MSEASGAIEVIDTRMWGMERMTTAFLVPAERPALVDTGPRTSYDVVATALADRGIGQNDLAWIVLTHVHLDHCGSTGDLAERFPRAQVVVHRRGARHLADPTRLVAGSAAVYGEHFSRYGGLAPVEESRIVVAEDDHRIALGGGRELVTLETPGHARHHNAYYDDGTGAVLSGDVVGMEFLGGGLLAALPPPDVDIAAGIASVASIAEREPTEIGVGHFGWIREPEDALDRAMRLWAQVGEAGRAGWRAEQSVKAVARAWNDAAAPEVTLSPEGHRVMVELGWLDHSIAGLAAWAEADASTE